MPVGLRKAFRFGPYRLNVSKSGISHTVKLGPWSWNSRQRRHRLDLPGPLYWQSRRKLRRRSRVDRIAVVLILLGALTACSVAAWQWAGDRVATYQQEHGRR
jgi:Protein of unknown function (DUF4236)